MHCSNRRHPVALAIALAMTACTSVDQAPEQPWRVEGVSRVQHSSATGNGPGYFALGRMYEGHARWDRAADAYRKAALADPANADYCNALGIALANSGRRGAAVVVFERAASLAPQRADLVNNLGYALMLDGEDERALRVLRTALQVDPEYAPARANLQLLESRMAALPQAPLAAIDGADATAALPVDTAPPAPALALQTAPTVAALDTAVTDDKPQAAAAMAAAAPSPAEHGEQVEPDKPARVQIVNGNGVRGAAATLRAQLGHHLVGTARLANLAPYRTDRSLIEYRSGFGQQALAIAHRMPVSAQLRRSQTLDERVDVRVLLGLDLKASAVALTRGPMNP